MKIYNLHSIQKLPISLDEAWDFLTNPRNLEMLTPSDMNFKVFAGADRPMYAGQLLQYTVTPLPGFNTKWVSEITALKEKEYFIDEQRFGPYAFWHHKHFIKEIPGGVSMEDSVDYKLPLGILGRVAHPILVKSKLDSIFEYRQEQLLKMFGPYVAPKKEDKSISKHDILN
ncbi:cell division inhibitor [Leeuwenhoekiella sp. NPDC079379]|uniref:cell division inhibitor n=1 Tax=Leeuwenhoekiella sp. NPDC079379 TaxID=3364122 RepID=UPI0037CC4273